MKSYLERRTPQLRYVRPTTTHLLSKNGHTHVSQVGRLGVSGVTICHTEVPYSLAQNRQGTGQTTELHMDHTNRIIGDGDIWRQTPTQSRERNVPFFHSRLGTGVAS